jgi:ankyrin repeat protein
MAIEAGDAEIAAALLKAGAKPDVRLARRNGMTLLMYAATINRQSGRTVRSLLQAGASHKARDDMGRSPLMHAAQAGNTTVILEPDVVRVQHLTGHDGSVAAS